MNTEDRDVVFRFGGFVVAPTARYLSLHEKRVVVGSRAFDLLLVLMASRGTVLSKRELMERVWPDTIVEENCLRVHIAALRKALGDYAGAIRTIPGRGYVWTAMIEVTTLDDAGAVSGPCGARPLELSRKTPTVQPWAAVIDDDPGVREAVCSLIESVGMAAKPFATIGDFLEHSESTEPACFVLDVRLPGRSGLDFLDDLMAQQVKIPAICISGYADVPMSVRAMKAGAREFLLKPIRHQDLIEAIQRVVPLAGGAF
jgi:DNA-binding response OmpR family regulator